MKPLILSTPGSRQRGAATLIVVMILFFVMTLVAAYTNRSLIFEQRTSANQYRSTQSLEIADAGMRTHHAGIKVHFNQRQRSIDRLF